MDGITKCFKYTIKPRDKEQIQQYENETKKEQMVDDVLDPILEFFKKNRPVSKFEKMTKSPQEIVQMLGDLTKHDRLKDQLKLIDIGNSVNTEWIKQASNAIKSSNPLAMSAAFNIDPASIVSKYKAKSKLKFPPLPLFNPAQKIKMAIDDAKNAKDKAKAEADDQKNKAKQKMQDAKDKEDQVKEEKSINDTKQAKIQKEKQDLLKQKDKEKLQKQMIDEKIKDAQKDQPNIQY